MITKYYPIKLSSYCKMMFCRTLGGMFKKHGCVYIEYSCIHGIDLFLVTPFSEQWMLDECLFARVFPYCYSSDNLSSIIVFFKKRYHSIHFKFVVYEK